MKTYTALDMESILAAHFDYRRNLIVPNICWGLGIHECDLLIVRPTGYAIEVEIKISAADLKKDFTKRHAHSSAKIKQLWYAVPRKLVALAEELVPEQHGILCVEESVWQQWVAGGYVPQARSVVTTIRKATDRKDARPLTRQEMADVGRLGTMRIWALKSTVRELHRKVADLKTTSS